MRYGGEDSVVVGGLRGIGMVGGGGVSRSGGGLGVGS